MSSEIKITLRRDQIASCNSCHAQTYESSLGINIGPKVDRLWDVHIGSMVACLCEDCLDELAEKINLRSYAEP